MKKLGIIFVLLFALCSCLSAKNLLNASYPELGITLGTPSGLNLAGGGWNGRFGVRATGMFYGPSFYGFQTTLGFKLLDDPKTLHSVGLAFGTFRWEFDDWTSVGAVYNTNFRGFFLETGLEVGRGDFSSPQFVLQIGYMRRFLPGPR